MVRLISASSKPISILLAALSFACLAGCFNPTSKEASPKGQDAAAPQATEVAANRATEQPGVSGAQVSVQPTNNSISPQRNSGWLLVAIASTLAAIASTCLSAYLLIWRRSLPDGQVSLLPEQVIDTMQQLAVSNMKHSKAAAAYQKEALSQFSDIQKGFDVLTALVAEKDKHIARLQNGGDKSVYVQFLKRFVRVLNLVDSDILEDQNNGKDVTALRSLRGYLADALLDAGLEEFSPSNGSDYRSSSGVADKPDVIETADPGQDWNISATIRPGFRIKTAEQPLVIESARVQIYRFKRVGD